MTNTEDVVFRCPRCGSMDVRYSYSRTAWDWILDKLFAMDAYRCRSCRTRFHRVDPDPDEPEAHS